MAEVTSCQAFLWSQANPCNALRTIKEKRKRQQHSLGAHCISGILPKVTQQRSAIWEAETLVCQLNIPKILLWEGPKQIDIDPEHLPSQRNTHSRILQRAGGTTQPQIVPSPRTEEQSRKATPHSLLFHISDCTEGTVRLTLGGP